MNENCLIGLRRRKREKCFLFQNSPHETKPTLSKIHNTYFSACNRTSSMFLILCVISQIQCVASEGMDIFGEGNVFRMTNDVTISPITKHTADISTNQNSTSKNKHANKTPARQHPTTVIECLKMSENMIDGVFCQFLHGLEMGLFCGIIVLILCSAYRLYNGQSLCFGKYYARLVLQVSSQYAPVRLDEAKYDSDDENSSIHMNTSDDIEMVPGQYVPRNLAAFEAYPKNKINS